MIVTTSSKKDNDDIIGQLWIEVFDCSFKSGLQTKTLYSISYIEVLLESC